MDGAFALAFVLCASFVFFCAYSIIGLTKRPTNDWRIYRDGNVFLMKRRYVYLWTVSRWETLTRYRPPNGYSGVRYFKSIEECEEWIRKYSKPSIEFVKEVSINT